MCRSSTPIRHKRQRQVGGAIFSTIDATLVPFGLAPLCAAIVTRDTAAGKELFVTCGHRHWLEPSFQNMGATLPDADEIRCCESLLAKQFKICPPAVVGVPAGEVLPNLLTEDSHRRLHLSTISAGTFLCFKLKVHTTIWLQYRTVMYFDNIYITRYLFTSFHQNPTRRFE